MIGGVGRRGALASALAVLAILVPATAAVAGTRTINFDDLTAPCYFFQTEPLSNQYAAMGVTFSGPAPGQGAAVLGECGTFGVSGYSTPNILGFNTDVDYPQPPETVTFAQPIHTFEIKAAQQDGGGIFTVTGFDGNTVVSENSRSSTAAMQPLALAASRITSVRLNYSGGTAAYMIFDDMTFGTTPASGNDAYAVSQNGQLNVAAAGVLANDGDADGDPLTAVLSRNPGNGTVQLNPNGSFSYRPTAGFAGNDSFGYKANDGTGNGGEANVAIKVNALPAPPPPPPVTPTKVLRTPAVTVGYAFFPKHPKKKTRFSEFVANNVPKGSKLVARCVTAKRKKCKGKLGKTLTIKKTKKKAVKISTLNKKYPAGVQLEVIVSKSGYKTQVKIIQIRKNKKPRIVTRCMTPPSKKRKSC